MKQEILLYLLETIASAEADDIDGDGFDMVWEDDLGREGWSTESITETAERAAVAIKNLSSAYEFLATEFGKVMYQAARLEPMPRTKGMRGDAPTFMVGKAIRAQPKLAPLFLVTPSRS